MASHAWFGALVGGAIGAALVMSCGRSDPDEELFDQPDAGVSGSAGTGGLGGLGGAGGSVGGSGGSTGGAGGSAGASGGASGAGGSAGCGSCAGCCDAAGICRSGTDVNACGLGGVECLDCGALGFGCSGGACEGPPPACGPATCAGCCDAQGQCKFGTESDACGGGGQACTDCALLGLGCTNGQCQGPPPACGPGNCSGCCDAAGVCVPGTSPSACGQAGSQCQNCAAAGKSCTQPGNYCAFFPSCGPATCPSGCCDASGNCQNGKTNAACGSNGQACKDCLANGQNCAASGFCYMGPHCGPDNCAGCCTANGTCLSGASSLACGQFGKLCDNCFAKGATCIGQVCSTGSTCPAPYAGCSPDALTPPPVPSTSCSNAELDQLKQLCSGPQPGPSCGQYYQSLLSSNPKCYDCLLQFSAESAYVRCLVPFLTPDCNHDLTCASFCSSTSCGQCSAGQEDQCSSQVFGSGGQCAPWVNGYFCAQAALSGPGAFCQFDGNVGDWIFSVGSEYCH